MNKIRMSTKDIEMTKMNQIHSRDKNIILEFKNLLVGCNSRVNIQRKEVAKLKTVNLKLLSLEVKRKKMKKRS